MAITINAKTSGAGGLETTADNTGNINIQSGGSTVMSISSTGVSVTGSFSQDGAVYSTQPSFRNRIINGDMKIDQRNAGASQNNSAGSAFSADRWKFYGDQATKFSIQQQTSIVPNNFTYALAITSLSAYTVGSGELFQVYQNLEGYNIADLGWGTAAAKTITLSFWVRSSLTGTFGGSLKNSASNRSYPFTYTISSANTWEKKSITIAGDTTGTWATNNSTGIALNIGLGVGSTYSGTAGSWAAANYLSATGATSVVGTSGATFYLTGVQLEVGSTATDFEVLPYDVQLARCQRYAYMIPNSDNTGVGDGAPVSTFGYVKSTGTTFVGTYVMPVMMRTTPTISVTGTSNLEVAYADDTITTVNGTSVSLIGHISNRQQILYTLSGSSGHASQPAFLRYKDSTMSPVFLIQAEL